MNRVLGWLLLLPAVALGTWQIVVPAARTVWTSVFQTRPLGDGGKGRFLGLEAYAEADLVGPVLLGLVLGLPAFVVAGLAGVAIGALAAGASDGLRLAVRGVLGVLMVLYAPIGTGLALRLAGRGDLGFGFLVTTAVLVVLPVGTALVALVVMAAAGPDGLTSAGRRVGAVALVLGVGLVAAMSLGLQMFGLPAAVTGVSRDSATPGVLIYLRGFQLLDLSEAAAVSTVLLGILAVLGVLVTVVLLAAGLRVEVTPEMPRGTVTYGPVAGKRRGSTGLGGVALVLAVLVLVVFLILARDWVAGLFVSLPPAIPFADATRIVVNTWVPPFVAVLVQVLVGALAGFGIGWLRPLGRGSEWLLLVFAPGLFVALTPLLVARFVAAIDGGSLGGSSLVPPLWVSIPAVYVFTFVAAGLRRAWDADPSVRSSVMVSGLATVALVFVVSWVVQAQTVTWNLVVAQNPERASGPLTLARLASTVFGEALPQQLATPVPLLAILAAVAAAATIGMDQVRVQVGRTETPLPTPPAPT